MYIIQCNASCNYGKISMIKSSSCRTRLGIAGWSIPSEFRKTQSAKRTLLEQYAELFDAVEINSSFYRPHKFSTYQRWGASVPEEFRFAVKIPRAITHERRLVDCREPLVAFMSCVLGLRDKLGALLVQLPPSCVFDESAARNFFTMLRLETSVLIACEPRSPTWFTPTAGRLLKEFGLVRVRADPTPAGCEFTADETWQNAYLRLHGSPRIYYSSYSMTQLNDLLALVAGPATKVMWCIFDNTAAGAAWPNALSLKENLRPCPPA